MLLFFCSVCSAQFNTTKIKITETLDFAGTNFRISGTNRLGFFGFLDGSNLLTGNGIALNAILTGHIAPGEVYRSDLNAEVLATLDSTGHEPDGITIGLTPGGLLEVRSNAILTGHIAPGEVYRSDLNAEVLATLDSTGHEPDGITIGLTPGGLLEVKNNGITGEKIALSSFSSKFSRTTEVTTFWDLDPLEWAWFSQAAMDSARWIAPLSVTPGMLATDVLDVNQFQRAPTPTGEFTIKPGGLTWNLFSQAAMDSARANLSSAVDSTHIKQNAISQGNLAGNAAVLSLNSSKGHVDIATSSTIDIQKPDDQTIEPSVKTGSLTAGHIATAQVVKRVNNLKDSVRVVAGSGISIVTAGDSITITASGGAPASAPDTIEINLRASDFELMSAFPAHPDTVTYMAGMPVLSFADGATNRAEIPFVTSSKIGEVTSIQLTVLWYAETGVIGNCRWEFGYLTMSPGDQVDSATPSTLIQSDAAGGLRILNVSTFNISTAAIANPNENVRIIFQRMGAHVLDTLTGNVHVTGGIIRYVVE